MDCKARMKRATTAIGAAVCTAALAPAAATAAIEVDRDGALVQVNGGPAGDRIDVSWSAAEPDEILISSRTAEPVVTDGECTPVAGDPRRARCDVRQLRYVHVTGYRGDDVLKNFSVGGDPGYFPAVPIVRGNKGDDKIFIAGHTARAAGNAGADRMASLGPETALGGGPGNDRLLARGSGRGTLMGGSHGDVLRAFKGRDLLLGGGGRDVLRAGRGSDQLFAGDGVRDKGVFCEGGNDWVTRDRFDPARRCETTRIAKRR